MSDLTPIPLTPLSIDLDSPEFEAICGWPFEDSYVGRLLRDDIPQRVRSDHGRVWVYRNPEGWLVGFGTLDVCEDYREFYSEDRFHPYIPLLAVNPTIKSLGFGTSIVRHLIAEAALLACRPGGCHDVLFLDVYTSNDRAIKLYEKCGFEKWDDEAIADQQEGGKAYFVMAKRVSIAPT